MQKPNKEEHMRIIAFGLLAATALAAPSVAQSVFDGTWKTDPSTIQMPQKPQVYLLEAGVYHCKTCVPVEDVKADGSDQPVKGSPYFDSAAITVVDDHTIKEVDKKGGKVVATTTTKVADDGKTASYQFSDSSDTSAAPVTGQGTVTRIKAGPKGSHAISGSWRDESKPQFSENALTVTYGVSGGDMMMSNPTGQSYKAAFDGKDAPYKGDPGITSVALEMMGKDSFVETDKRNGKAISKFKMTVAADGKTATGVYTDLQAGRTYKWTSVKQ
jgi:hypothetical protein